MKKLLLVIALSTLSSLSYAGDDTIITSYTARIGANDRVNSDGTRLKSVADIIRQDRANFHKFGTTDLDDQADDFFKDAKNRERIPAMLKKGHIDKATQNAILNESPLISVDVYRNHIDVSLQ
jgi:hypothetical protein